MFPKRIKNNQSGMILIAISVLSLIMMIIALGIISLSTSQSISNQHQVDRIKANQLAQGAWWYQYSNKITGGAATIEDETIDGKTYTITITPPTVDDGPNQTDTYSVEINY